MMKEIERKFLVKSDQFKVEAYHNYKIVQGFLNSNKHRTVRVRLKDEQGFLTVKGLTSKDGLERFEWEREITKLEAEALLKLCERPIIDKIRHEVKVADHIFEVDEFKAENNGLVIAEIELNNKVEAFRKPTWLGREVTGDIRYYNSSLINNPFKNWKNV